MERYLYLADRVSGQVSSDGKMLESATPPRDIQQVEFIADDDSTSLLEEIPYEKFLPRHPPSHITRLQNDGSRVQEKIEKVENAFDEVLPIGMKLVLVLWYADLYMPCIEPRSKLEDNASINLSVKQHVDGAVNDPEDRCAKKANFTPTV
ncbi:hypothetical protein M9H77_25929 [Catharanthus roseus]|uniref:Uncharacterized protein n=1 Tax=Catharanthus roseus TaxID=4058 RepID=A0ACC0ACA6_CATRO|nr:hypothetical protein M9H77_25929 [Catharanthus roseus]